MVKKMAEACHHTLEYGDFRILIFQENMNDHVVLIKGDIEGQGNILCRVSSECLPGTALFSAECDCKDQIQKSLKLISENEQGIFIYLRQEGRGHGLVKKIQALANKNKGMDTFQAVECMGLSADIRKYNIVKDILDYFKVESIRCIANNPEKVKLMEREGIEISEVINIPVVANIFSKRHLEAKINRGHNIEIR